MLNVVKTDGVIMMTRGRIRYGSDSDIIPMMRKEFSALADMFDKEPEEIDVESSRHKTAAFATHLNRLMIESRGDLVLRELLIDAMSDVISLMDMLSSVGHICGDMSQGGYLISLRCRSRLDILMECIEA